MADVPVFTQDQINTNSPSPPPDQAPTDAPTSPPNNTSNSTAVSLTDSAASATSPTPTSQQYLPATEKNVLYKYRSFTYNFTLGAISPEAVRDSSLISTDLKKYTVLSSSGKGNSGMGLNPVTSPDLPYTTAAGLVGGFNKNSPGRFDMWIDNVLIDSLIGAGSKGTGNSIASNITFDVYEPYSLNGFFEALQISAVAAGYSDYQKGAFGLAVQFIGWPDDTGNSSRPETVPQSTRYFMIQITGVSVDVSENGTRYKVECVPLPQMSFSSVSNVSKQDFNIAGGTIHDVLTAYFIALNEAEGNSRKSATATQNNGSNHTWYEISAPKLVTPGGPKQDTKGARLYSPDPLWQQENPALQNDIIKSNMHERAKSPNVQNLTDPKNATGKAQYKGQTAPTGGNATAAQSSGAPLNSSPDNSLGKAVGSFTFSANSNIHDNISNIVRDSEYARNLLTPENIKKVQDGDGMLTYWTIRTEYELREFDKVNNHYFRTVRYVLEPFKIHYTRIPGQQVGSDTMTPLKSQIKREYDYIYTGKNLDIMKFNIKFDNLFFSAMPSAMNGITKPQGANAAGKKDTVASQQTQQTTASQQAGKTSQVPDPSLDVDTTLNTTGGSNAGVNQDDPYYTMAKAMHESVINGVDNLQANLTILGDPYFLVTGGMTNGNLSLESPMKTTDGQAATTQGDVFIYLTFRNPIDINPVTGLLDFDSKVVPFSGVFQLVSLKSYFKDGVFTQDLDLLRIPGQIIKGNTALPANMITKALAGAQVIKDAAKNILTMGSRLSDLSLTSLFGSGFPVPSLPGGISVPSSVTGALDAVASAASSINPNNLNLNVAGLPSVANAIGSNIASAGGIVNSITNIPGAASNLAASVTAQAGQLTAAGSAAASGIVNSVSALGGTAASAISGVGSAITSLQNPFPSDPSGIAASLGINPSQISGLSSNLQSMISSKLSGLSSFIPSNTDLTGLLNQGLSFGNISEAHLPNLPAMQPKAIADLQVLSPAAVSNIVATNLDFSALKSGGSLADLTNFPGVTNIMGQIGSSVNGLGSSLSSMTDKLGSAASQLGSSVVSAAGLPANAANIASSAIQSAGPASIGLGSVESNQALVQNLVQNQGALPAISSAVPVQFGSILQTSPLTTLVQTNNITGNA